MTVKTREKTGDGNDMITECVGKLVQAFDARFADDNRDPYSNELIGEIRIIVDAKNTIDIGKIVQRDLIYKTRRSLFLVVRTVKDADTLERMLMTWASDVASLKDVIAILQPDYYEPKWQEDLETVAVEIADVLSRAMVIEPTAQRHILLRKATKKLPWTRDC
jgi:hypothetical protein